MEVEIKELYCLFRWLVFFGQGAICGWY